MEMSQQGIGSGVVEVAEVGVSTVARSRPSRKNVAKPISNGPTHPKARKKSAKRNGLSDTDLINITMNGLVQLQERFGKFYTVPATGSQDPALLVIPLELDLCPVCGKLIIRNPVPHCVEVKEDQVTL